MKNKILFIVLFAASFFWGCRKTVDNPKQPITLDKSSLERAPLVCGNCTCPDIPCMIESSIPTQNRGNMILFHFANAIREITSDSVCKKLMVKTLNEDASTGRFIGDLAFANGTFKTKLNDGLRLSINSYVVYPAGDIEIQPILTNPNGDLMTFLINKLKEVDGVTEPAIGSIEDFTGFDTSKPLTIILGVDTKCSDVAAGWENNSQMLFDSLSSRVRSNHAILVTSQERNLVAADRDEYGEEDKHELHRWWGHGKVRLLENSNTNISAYVQWQTKYRWYNLYKNKESATLNTPGDITQFYYWEYRIRAVVKHNWFNYTVLHRNSPDLPWKTVF